MKKNLVLKMKKSFYGIIHIYTSFVIWIFMSFLEELLIIYVYFLGCSLSLVENQYWQMFMHMLRPTYDIPTRYMLSNDLLNKTYESVKKDVEEKIASSNTVTIQLDTWSNIRNEGIVNFIINTPEPVFYKSVETKTESQNAEFYLEEVSLVIDELGAKIVISVITDNASVCQKFWRLLEKKYAEDCAYGCAAHS